jgi:hypothetical protein
LRLKEGRGESQERQQLKSTIDASKLDQLLNFVFQKGLLFSTKMKKMNTDEIKGVEKIWIGTLGSVHLWNIIHKKQLP